jgi:hypothetical protein
LQTRLASPSPFFISFSAADPPRHCAKFSSGAFLPGLSPRLSSLAVSAAFSSVNLCAFLFFEFFSNPSASPMHPEAQLAALTALFRPVLFSSADC